VSFHSKKNYSTSKPLKVSPEKSHILSCDTVVANERYVSLSNAFLFWSAKYKVLTAALLGTVSRLECDAVSLDKYLFTQPAAQHHIPHSLDHQTSSRSSIKIFRNEQQIQDVQT